LLDINKLEEFVEKAQYKGSSAWLRPRPNPDGSSREYNLRLLPPAGDAEQPFFTTKQHYIVAGKERLNGACPQAADKGTCPACQMFFDLLKVIDRDNEKPFWAAARKLSPTDRYYANFLDRDTDEVKIWSMSYSVFTALYQTVTSYLKQGVDITDPEVGRDFTISVSKSGAVQAYGNIILAANGAPVDHDGWEEELHDLESLAHQRILDADNIAEAIPDTLAEFYPETMKRLEKDEETKVDGGLLD